MKSLYTLLQNVTSFLDHLWCRISKQKGSLPPKPLQEWRHLQWRGWNLSLHQWMDWCQLSNSKGSSRNDVVFTDRNSFFVLLVVTLAIPFTPEKWHHFLTASTLMQNQRDFAHQIRARMEASAMARMELVTALTDGLVPPVKLQRVNQTWNQGG